MARTERIETLAIHAGRQVDPATGAVSPPLYLSTTFQRDADGGYSTGFDYIRDAHPNRDMLERTLAALESGSDAVAFSSGTAATLAVFHAAGPGHIVATHDAYHGTLHQLQNVVAGWGTDISFVPTTSIDSVANAIRDDTRLLWIETPSNPLLRVTDLAALRKLIGDRDIVLAVDNTIATPILQQPLLLGADIVVHSTTKYIGGHSDVAGGAVVGRDHPIMKPVREYHTQAGAVPSAFDCWLLQRSIATLPVRVRLHAQNASKLAAYLQSHNAITQVDYPGLTSHPDHAIAAQQMNGFGGLVSFHVNGDAAAAMRVASRARLFTRATSLGGVESLIEHRASIEGPDSHAPPNLLRLSVGIEHIDDLIADLSQALESIGS
ncbi:MAG: aminotransferase class I/II-fold pyridoxal phosphate-dependent enzyme [Gammaproteobacteria bacterium]|nr:aminotransferase class I/II-fold pyridoxal phosphate-dependent enzyme [Gammaproteobacteria bacterium]